ncbi:MAG: HAS-barrel domain-containing protein [Anaerolineales bacterium]
MQAVEIGRVLRATTTGFTAGCRVGELAYPLFGGLVRVSLASGEAIYGLIYDIRIEDDGLVRQLVTAEGVSREVIADNRANRNVPIEMSALSVGYEQGGRIFHLLPPRPPLSLDALYLCSSEEVRGFTSAGRFGYFRHILRATDLPVSELLAAHLQQAQSAHAGSDWQERATQELITLLRDDYPVLMGTLSALGDL